MRFGLLIFGVVLWIPTLASLCAAQDVQQPAGSVEIVRVADTAIEITIRNGENFAVEVAVSDKAQRLNGFGYQWEGYADGGWTALTAKPPCCMVVGDLPPQFVEIKAGQTANFRVDFSARFWGVKGGEKLRIVVKTWHHEPNRGATELRIASSPFVWTEPPAKN